MFARTATWAVLLAAAGCAAPTGPSTTAGYVLLDRDARAAGTLSIGSWQGAPRLPVSAEVGDTVVFAGESGERPIEVRAGALAYLHGPSGDVEWVELGTIARSDALLVEGNSRAAEVLARTVGASATEAGRRYRIAVPEAFFRIAFSNEPEGLAESFPDYESQPRGESSVRLTAGPAWSPEAAEAVRDVADIVGVYQHEGHVLVIDAAGHYTMDPTCLAEARPTGQASVSGARVALVSDRGRAVFNLDGDDLVETSGRRFTLVRPEPPPLRKRFGVSEILDEP